jgi:hypothetical protein
VRNADDAERQLLQVRELREHFWLQLDSVALSGEKRQTQK